METSTELWLGLLTAIVIPGILWAYNMHTMTKKLLDMHENPDDYDFGTEATNKLVLENRNLVLNASKDQARYLHELVHYTKAMCRLANNGKEILPPEPRNELEV